MIHFFLLLAVADITNLSEARQELEGSPSDIFYDGVGGSTSDQPFTFESDPSTYGDGGIAAQPQPLISADLDSSPDHAYLASVFSNTDGLDMSDDSLFSPSLLASTGTSLPDANLETGYDESTVAFNKFPLYTLPSDQKGVVFPFNCWKENRDGIICWEDRCQLGTATSSSLSRKIFQDRLTNSNDAAFVYVPGDIGIRFCCDRYDDRVRKPSTSGNILEEWPYQSKRYWQCFDTKAELECVPAPEEDQLVA